MVKRIWFAIKRYPINILIGIDQLVNALMLGDPYETMSSRAGRLFKNSWWMDLINTVMFWQKDHCQNAVEGWVGKYDLLHPEKNKTV